MSFSYIATLLMSAKAKDMYRHDIMHSIQNSQIYINDRNYNLLSNSYYIVQFDCTINIYNIIHYILSLSCTFLTYLYLMSLWQPSMHNTPLIPRPACISSQSLVLHFDWLLLLAKLLVDAAFCLLYRDSNVHNNAVSLCNKQTHNQYQL